MTQGHQPGGSQQSWSSRVQQLRQDAEKDLPNGAVTTGYKANREEIIELLNHAVANEWTGFLQYWHHYFMASDIHNPGIKEIWKQHAEEEYEHAQKFNQRINELGGVPANAPKQIEQMTPAHFEAGHDLRSMIQADLIAERITIEFYAQIIRTCGFDDPATREMVEDILIEENEHANELSNLLFQFDATTGKQIPTLHDEVMGQQGQQRRAAA